MKDVTETLGILKGTLNHMIKNVTNYIAPQCRAAGLASLPDELLARIFELCHLDSCETWFPDDGEEDSADGRLFARAIAWTVDACMAWRFAAIAA